MATSVPRTPGPGPCDVRCSFSRERATGWQGPGVAESRRGTSALGANRNDVEDDVEVVAVAEAGVRSRLGWREDSLRCSLPRLAPHVGWSAACTGPLPDSLSLSSDNNGSTAALMDCVADA